MIVIPPMLSITRWTASGIAVPLGDARQGVLPRELAKKSTWSRRSPPNSIAACRRSPLVNRPAVDGCCSRTSRMPNGSRVLMRMCVLRHQTLTVTRQRLSSGRLRLAAPPDTPAARPTPQPFASCSVDARHWCDTLKRETDHTLGRARRDVARL